MVTKEELREKLRKRCGRMRNSRARGSDPRMARWMQREDSDDMAQNIQQTTTQTKRMKKRARKKRMRDLMQNVRPEDMGAFRQTLQQINPEAVPHLMRTGVAQTKRTPHATAPLTPSPPPPISHVPVPKRKKRFQRTEIRLPNLRELKSHPSISHDKTHALPPQIQPQKRSLADQSQLLQNLFVNADLPVIHPQPFQAVDIPTLQHEFESRVFTAENEITVQVHQCSWHTPANVYENWTLSRPIRQWLTLLACKRRHVPVSALFETLGQHGIAPAQALQRTQTSIELHIMDHEKKLTPWGSVRVSFS